MPTNANTVPDQSSFGYAISWGLGSVTYAVGSVTGLVQSSDDQLTYDFMEVRDGQGTTRATVFYNPHDELTLEYVVVNTGSFDSITASISYPSQGTLINISNAGDVSDPISSSNWQVQSVTIRRTNTDATKVQLKAVRYGGVTQ